LKEKNDNEVRAAQAGHMKLKTLKHPNVLKYIDGMEVG
jgi:hypothetical protein